MAMSPTQAKELPPLDELRGRFHYDPRTGVITETRIVGSLRCDKHGYRSIIIGHKSRLYKAHRLAWKIYYGSEPPAVIDHINGDSTDNSISNLRASCFTTNSQNTNIRKNNSSSVTGVKYHRKNKNYVAQINVNGDRFHLGSFSTLAAAAEARRAAETRYFGEFAGIHRGAQS